MPAFEQLAIKRTPLRAVLRDAIAETRRVVHVVGVRELVDQQVADDFRPLERQTGIQAYRATD